MVAASTPFKVSTRPRSLTSLTKVVNAPFSTATSTTSPTLAMGASGTGSAAGTSGAGSGAGTSGASSGAGSNAPMITLSMT